MEKMKECFKKNNIIRTKVKCHMDTSLFGSLLQDADQAAALTEWEAGAAVENCSNIPGMQQREVRQ